MRLQNRTRSYDTYYSTATFTGRVEVCINGNYGSICDASWDEHDAQVACKRIYGSGYGKSVAISQVV